MAFCICGESALLCWRGTDALTSKLVGAPRTGKLDACSLARRKDVDAALVAARLDLKPKTMHLMVPGNRSSHTPQGIARHVRTAPLPSRALVRLTDDVLVSSPELLFVELAPTLTETKLILLGFELCGAYVLDSGHSAGFRKREPLMTVAGALRFLDGCGEAKGVAKARRALATVLDGSRSPMETALALMLCAPRRMGGLGFAPPLLNEPVRTADGVKYVDVCWPERGLGLEYQGRAYHDDAQAQARDGRRESRLLASGMRIIDVWYDDVRNERLFDKLAKDVAVLLGTRLRIRSGKFEKKQWRLRADVLPPVV